MYLMAGLVLCDGGGLAILAEVSLPQHSVAGQVVLHTRPMTPLVKHVSDGTFEVLAGVFEERVVEEVTPGGDWQQRLVCVSEESVVDVVLCIVVAVVAAVYAAAAAVTVALLLDVVHHVCRISRGFCGHFTVVVSDGGRLLCGCHCCFVLRLSHKS